MKIWRVYKWGEFRKKINLWDILQERLKMIFRLNHINLIYYSLLAVKLVLFNDLVLCTGTPDSKTSPTRGARASPFGRAITYPTQACWWHVGPASPATRPLRHLCHPRAGFSLALAGAPFSLLSAYAPAAPTGGDHQGQVSPARPTLFPPNCTLGFAACTWWWRSSEGGDGSPRPRRSATPMLPLLMPSAISA
jgi:hypothetical protein